MSKAKKTEQHENYPQAVVDFALKQKREQLEFVLANFDNWPICHIIELNPEYPIRRVASDFIHESMRQLDIGIPF